jgi:hypothetical protein
MTWVLPLLNQGLKQLSKLYFAQPLALITLLSLYLYRSLNLIKHEGFSIRVRKMKLFSDALESSQKKLLANCVDCHWH